MELASPDLAAFLAMVQEEIADHGLPAFAPLLCLVDEQRFVQITGIPGDMFEPDAVQRFAARDCPGVRFCFATRSGPQEVTIGQNYGVRPEFVRLLWPGPTVRPIPRPDWWHLRPHLSV